MSRAIENSYEVVIVGAGPCGVTAAGLLGSYGVNTLLIDLEAQVVDIPRAVGICDEGSRILSAAGMLEHVEPGLLDIDLVEFTDKNRQQVMFSDLCKTRNGYRLLRMFSQPDLERGLRAGLHRHEHLHFHTQTRLVGFSETESGVSLTLEQKGEVFTTSCQYLLACDGAKSTIRKELDIGFQGKTYAQDWMILDIENNPIHNRSAAFNIDPERPSVTMPGPNGKRRWEFVVKEGENEEELFSEQNLKNMLKPWGRLEDMNLIRRAIYTFHARTAKHYQKGRVFLLGDAAHLTPPFAGQGMMAGLRDAYNLAWKLASVLQNKTDRSLLDSYEIERIPQSRQVINTAQIMGALILPQTRVRAKVRDGLIGFLRLLGLHSPKKALPLSRVPNHINGSFWRNLYRQKYRGVGVEFPQAIVTDAHGTSKPMDKFLGDKFYLVSWERQAENMLGSQALSDWKSIGGRSVVLGSTITNTEGLNLVDGSASYASLFEEGERILVIRPDKMIVIACSARHLEKQLTSYMQTIRPKVQASHYSSLQEV